jgi:hypothetical protein
MIPRLCDGGTVVCLASGPSLTTEDVNYVRGKAIVLAINDAIRLAPWADALHSSDSIWWQKHYRQMRTFHGLKFRVNPSLFKPSEKVPPKTHCQGCKRRLERPDKPCWCEGIITLRNAGYRGLSLEPGTIVTTENSGGAAINIAVHLGAKQIVLLGYDMGPHNGRKHFYDTEPKSVMSPYMKFRKLIATMVEPLNQAGVEVVNCSRRSALECFPMRPLREVILERAA